MTSRWLFTSVGEAPLYQDDDYIYSKDGVCKYSVSGGWWYDIKNGRSCFLHSRRLGVLAEREARLLFRVSDDR